MELLKRWTVGFSIAMLGIAAAPGAQPDRSPLRLAVPQHSNAHVSLASRESFVVAVWAASTPTGATDVYAAVSRNGGAAFDDPVRVNGTRGHARVNGEQPPRVALVTGTASTPGIVVVWTAAGEGGTRLFTARSHDGGASFSAERLVPGTDAPGNRGWEAIAASGTATQLVWLDHRQLAAPGGQPHQHGASTQSERASADGVAMAQRSQLYVARLDGAESPRPITGGVCYCCKTAIATTGARVIFLAWRHVYPGNLRDIAFSVSRDGGRTFAPPIRVSEDNWAINGCPDDGPAMAVDARGRVHVVWPTVVTSNGAPAKALFHALSTDGRTFGPRTRIPTSGQPNHPHTAVTADGSLFVAWDEAGGGGRTIKSVRGSLDARNRITFTPLSSPGAGTYPTLAATAPKSGTGRVVRAWTRDGVIHVDRP